jgi:nicotinamide-nucleotide amidase
MRAMFDASVLPDWLEEGGFLPCAARVLWTAGAPEAEIAAAIESHMKREEPTVGTHPDDGEVAVRILARGPGAIARADALRDELAAVLAPHVVSIDEERRVQHAVVARLAARGLVLVTAESITGGLVSRMLTEVPGASAVFRGGFVTYSDAWKRDQLGVAAGPLEEGAVSEAVAIAMAEGARARTKADVAVATTGVAGPGPDERGVPAGTAYVAVASRFWPPSCVVVRAEIPRVAFQRRVAVTALDQVRRRLPA